MLLKFLAIFLGILIAVTRGYGMLFPTKMKEMITKMVAEPKILRAWGLVLIGLSILSFAAVGRDVSGARIIMLFVGISALSGAFVLVFWSKRYALLAEWFMNLPEPTMRILYGIGFAFGVLLIVLGISYY